MVQQDETPFGTIAFVVPRNDAYTMQVLPGSKNVTFRTQS